MNDALAAVLILIFCTPIGWIGMIIFFVGLNSVLK